MNHEEAGKVCFVASQLFNSFKPEKETYAAWGLVLDDIRFEDAKTAVVNLAKRDHPFVSPTEIRSEVRRIREKRLAEAPEPTPPPELPTSEYISWLRAQREAIADGNPPHATAIEAPQRDLTPLKTLLGKVDDA